MPAIRDTVLDYLVAANDATLYAMMTLNVVPAIRDAEEMVVWAPATVDAVVWAPATVDAVESAVRKAASDYSPPYALRPLGLLDAL